MLMRSDIVPLFRVGDIVKTAERTIGGFYPTGRITGVVLSLAGKPEGYQVKWKDGYEREPGTAASLKLLGRDVRVGDVLRYQPDDGSRYRVDEVLETVARTTMYQADASKAGSSLVTKGIDLKLAEFADPKKRVLLVHENGARVHMFPIDDGFPPAVPASWKDAIVKIDLVPPATIPVKAELPYCDVCGREEKDLPVEVCRHCYDVAHTKYLVDAEAMQRANRLADECQTLRDENTRLHAEISRLQRGRRG